MGKDKSVLIILVIIVFLLILFFKLDILKAQTTITIPQCQQDSDCPIPVKNSCDEFFLGCQNNICIYNQDDPVCMNELVTLLLDIDQADQNTEIDVGPNEFVFSTKYLVSNLDFGDQLFKAYTDFTCTIAEGEIYSYPQPNSECYSAEVEFMGETYYFDDNEKINLKDNIQAEYTGAGKVIGESDEVNKKSLGGRFIFTITDPLSLDIQDKSEVLHNSDKEINIQITNNLPANDILIKVKQKVKRINLNLPIKQVQFKASEGMNVFQYEIDTENLGINEFEVQAFYRLNVNGKQVLLPSSIWKFNYNIVDELSGIGDVVVIDDEPTDEEDIPLVYIVGGAVAIFLLLLLVKRK